MRERLADDARRGRERAVHVAAAARASHDDLVRRKSRLDARHRRARLVVDDRGFAPVGSDSRALGDNRRHRLAHEPRDPVGQRRPRRRREPAAVETRRQRPHGAGEITGGEDGDDAVDGARRAGIDAPDDRVRVRTAYEGEMQHARQHEVVDEAAGTSQEPRVLEAPHGRAGVRHRATGRRCSRAAARHPTAIGRRHRSPSSFFASSFVSPPMRGCGRPPSVTTIASTISFARGASATRISMAS